MASPQEVIERAIHHPADSTPESRRAASTRVLQALAANQYHFMRRRTPVLDDEDGECRHCKREMVHVDHGDAYMDALQRMASMAQAMSRMETVLRGIADDASEPKASAKAAGVIYSA